MEAPASRASAATSALQVSMEIKASGNSAAIARMTGRTRRFSAQASTGWEPGRVDSPPISRISTPAARKRRAISTTASHSLFPRSGELGAEDEGNKPIPRKTIRGDVQNPHHIGAFTPRQGMAANGQGGHYRSSQRLNGPYTI